MNKIIAFTFPRSGQHLLIWLLEKYFSRNLDFKHDPQKAIKAGDFQVCQRGGNNHCDVYPCIDKKTTYQATHNDRDVPLNDAKLNYIFQYRNPINSVISLFGYKPLHIKEEKIRLDFIKYILWWKEWVEIFIYSCPIKENILRIVYEDLIDNPVDILSKIIKFISPSEKIDKDFLLKVVSNQDITIKHVIKDYSYYKIHLELLKTIQKGIECDLVKLNIPKIDLED